MPEVALGLDIRRGRAAGRLRPRSPARDARNPRQL